MAATLDDKRLAPSPNSKPLTAASITYRHILPAMVLFIRDGMSASEDHIPNLDVQSVAHVHAIASFPDLSSSQFVTVVDYGCGASNWVAPIKAVLKTLTPGEHVNIVLNERPDFDWNSVSAAVTENWNELTRDGALNVYVSMCPVSFYNQIVMDGSVDIAVSWSSLNYLEHPLIEDNAEQAHNDLVKLLKLRAVETTLGGCFVGAIVGTYEGKRVGQPPNSPLVQATTKAWESMVKDGTVTTQEQLLAPDSPMYERTKAQVRKAIDEVSDVWVINDLSQKTVLHPAWEALQKSSKKSEDYYKYGERMSRYAVGALRVDGQEDKKAEEEVLGELRDRIEAYLLCDYKDEPSGVEYVYFELVRK